MLCSSTMTSVVAMAVRGVPQPAVPQPADPFVVSKICDVVGSGPFGGSAVSSYHTVLEHPARLTLGHGDKAVRRDVELGPGGLAFVIDNVLSADEADKLVELTETMGYSEYAPNIRTPPGMRQNKAVHWFPSPDTVEKFLEPMWARIAHLVPSEVEGGDSLMGLSHRFAHYKYDSGDVFNRHTDGEWPGQGLSATGDRVVEWPGVVSKLSMLLYLSEHEEQDGGKTRLYRFDGGEPVDVAPKKGSALFFRHGFGPDSVLHAGLKLSGEKPKYVARLNVLYSA